MKKYSFKILAKLEGGTPIIFDGSDIVTGVPVYTVDNEGKELQAVDGTYTLEDGTQIIVKDHKVDSTIEGNLGLEPEDVTVEDLAVVEPEAETPAVAEQENVDLTAIQNAIQELSDLIKGLQTTQAEMKAEFEAEKNQVNEKFSAVSTQSVTEKEPEIKVEKSYPEQIMDRIRILNG